MKMAFSDVFEVHVFMIILKQLIVKQRLKENTPLFVLNMYRYVVIITLHGESTISTFTKFFKSTLKKVWG